MKKQLLFISSLVFGGVAFSQTIFSENFNSTTGTALPASWAQTTSATDGGYKSGTSASLSSTYFPIPTNGTRIVATNDDACNCDKSADFLSSPAIDLSTVSFATLDFDLFYAEGSYNGVSESAELRISTDNGTTWSTLQALSGAGTWQSLSVSLNAYVGQTVKIGFFYNDGGEWQYGLAIDNFVVRQPSPDDAKVLSATLNRYSLTNTDNTLSLSVKNDGSNAITSLTINWNDGTDHSAVISTSIAAGATANVNHSVAVNYATIVEKSIAVSVTNVNGNTDPNMGNNTAPNLPFNTISQVPNKNVVIEEGTGTWCGWCPRGAVAMEALDAAHPTDFIGIAVHNGDPMTVTEYDGGANFSGFPGANVDRVMLGVDVSTTDFTNYYNTRKMVIEPASVAATATMAGSTVTVDASATFYTMFASGNFRLGMIAVEDSVHGTASTYDQHNYYSSQSQNIALTGAGHNWQTEPQVVPAANMWYNHVGRALIGTYAGQTGSVPASINDGTVANYTFTYTVPATSNAALMHYVVVLIDQSNGEIINAAKASPALGLNEVKTIDMNVFPNPSSDMVNVSFTAEGGDYAVTLTDLSGKVISTQAVAGAAGTQSVKVDVTGLCAGSYLITVSGKGASYTQHVVVK